MHSFRIIYSKQSTFCIHLNYLYEIFKTLKRNLEKKEVGETVVGDIIGSNHRKCARPNSTLHFEIWTNTFCNSNKYILKFGEIHFTIWTITESAPDLTLLFTHLRRALIGLDHSFHYYWVVSMFLIDCFALVKVL